MGVFGDIKRGGYGGSEDSEQGWTGVKGVG